MIQKFVDRFIANAENLKARYEAKRPDSYDSLFADVVEIVADEDGYEQPDPSRITVIDHGDYQGSRLFVVGCTGYQPSTYWSCLVSYGSCSGCDAFQSSDTAKEFYTLALHMVQNLRCITEPQ